MSIAALIVDDEKPIRDMVCFALRQSNIKCRHAADSESAYQEICTERPDIILLDWMLPNSNGIDFAKMLNSRDIYRDIPIIMLTAKTEEEDKLKGFRIGIDDYIIVKNIEDAIYQSKNNNYQRIVIISDKMKITNDKIKLLNFIFS